MQETTRKPQRETDSFELDQMLEQTGRGASAAKLNQDGMDVVRAILEEQDGGSTTPLERLFVAMQSVVKLLPDPSSTQFDWAHNLPAAELSRARQHFGFAASAHSDGRLEEARDALLKVLAALLRLARDHAAELEGSPYAAQHAALVPLVRATLDLLPKPATSDSEVAPG